MKSVHHEKKNKKSQKISEPIIPVGTLGTVGKATQSVGCSGSQVVPKFPKKVGTDGDLPITFTVMTAKSQVLTKIYEVKNGEIVKTPTAHYVFR